MQSVDVTVLLLALAVLLGTARMLAELAQWLRQPAVLGEILAGVLLGPTLFGAIAPEWQSYLFPPHGPNAIVLDGLATLAIVLFLLVAGLEVDLSTVWKQGPTALKVGIAGMLVPFGWGLLCAGVMPTALGRPADADPLTFALFVGTALAITALPVIAKTLMDLKLYRTDLGMIVISAAILNDLAGWTVFAVILGTLDVGATGPNVPFTVVATLLFTGLMLTVGRALIHRLLPYVHAYTQWPGGVLGFATALALLGAALTNSLGVHAIFGAFIVGVAIGDSTHLREHTRVVVAQFVSYIFAPLFFASIGLQVNFATHFDLSLTLLVLAVACFGKFAGAALGARWAGLPTRSRWAIGLAMNARGAMEIILGLLALEAGLIGQPLFVALVVMAIVTSMMSGPMMRWILAQREPTRLRSLLSSQLFMRNLAAATRRDAIRELASLVSNTEGCESEPIDAAVWAREEAVPTGIGNGVAVPQARLASFKRPVVAVGLSDAGIDFDAPDGRPAHAVFLIITPLEAPEVHLDVLAEIAGIFTAVGAKERVLRANNYTEFVGALRTV
jgi:Kef-type K+ transport system membrane component KefB